MNLNQWHFTYLTFYISYFFSFIITILSLILLSLFSVSVFNQLRMNLFLVSLLFLVSVPYGRVNIYSLPTEDGNPARRTETFKSQNPPTSRSATNSSQKKRKNSFSKLDNFWRSFFYVSWRNLYSLENNKNY